jgi:gas vesicle protein
MDPVYNPSLPSSSGGTSWSASSSECTSRSALVAGLCAGAVVGAAAALMFAPMRGAQLRSSIRGYAAQGGERLSHLVESGRCLAEDAMNRAGSLIEEGRRAFRTNYNPSSSATYSGSSEPLTASVAEISGLDRRFDEPLGG